VICIQIYGYLLLFFIRKFVGDIDKYFRYCFKWFLSIVVDSLVANLVIILNYFIIA
jgi:hypothetical protein